MKKNLSLILAGALFFGVTAVSSYQLYSQNTAQTEVSQTVTTTENESLLTVTQIIIADVDQEPRTIETEIEAGASVLTALQSSQEIEVEVTEYDFGTLIESINQVKNGTDDTYWIFSVNDQEATIGADQYMLEDGDVVTWEFKAYEE
jgi:hypothetical protein